jgi:nucleoid DNA-binding protein
MRKFLYLFPLFLIGYTAKCQSSAKQPITNFNFRIEINIIYNYINDITKYVVDNSNIDNNLSPIERSWSLKPFTLYRFTYIRGESKVDTSQVEFGKTECDSLFRLASNFFRKFQFQINDSISNGRKIEIHDFGHWEGNIQLEFKGRQLRANIADIENSDVSNTEFSVLHTYISNFF